MLYSRFISAVSVRIAVAALAFASACTVYAPQRSVEPPKTQLQTRQYQTREFDTNDTKLIMKAVLNVLQDEGFNPKNAVVDLGLLTATKEIDLQGSSGGASSASSDGSFWVELLRAMGESERSRRRSKDEVRFDKFKRIEATVNVTAQGRVSKVRANFQVTIIDNAGNPTQVYQIEDAKFYQDFFSKVDKGVFLQREGL